MRKSPYLEFFADMLLARYRKPLTPYLYTTASFKFAFCAPFFRYYINHWGVRKIILFFGFHHDEQVDDLFADISGHFDAAPQIVKTYPAVDELLGQATLYEFSPPDCTIAIFAYRQASHATMDAHSSDAWNNTLRPNLLTMLERPEFGVASNVWRMKVDNDEWLYSPYPNRVLRKTRQLFHYLDFAPTSTKERHEWSIQPMVVQRGPECISSGRLIHTCKLRNRVGATTHMYKPKRRKQFLLEGRTSCARFDPLLSMDKATRQHHYEKLGNVCKCYHLPFLNLDEKLLAYERLLPNHPGRRRYDHHMLAAAYALPWNRLTVSDNFLFDHLEPVLLTRAMDTMAEFLAQLSKN